MRHCVTRQFDVEMAYDFLFFIFDVFHLASFLFFDLLLVHQNSLYGFRMDFNGSLTWSRWLLDLPILAYEYVHYIVSRSDKVNPVTPVL